MKHPRKLSPKHSSAMRKAAGREPSRVQTPEGEKKFGQKIGEIIRPDGMKPRDDPAIQPDVAAKAKATKVKPVTARKGSAHVADVATQAVAAKKPEPAKATKPKVLTSVGGGGPHEGGGSADHVPERDVREGVPASGSGGPPEEPPGTPSVSAAADDPNPFRGLDPEELAGARSAADAVIRHFRHFSGYDDEDIQEEIRYDLLHTGYFDDDTREALAIEAIERSRRTPPDIPAWPGAEIEQVSRDRFDEATAIFGSQQFYDYIDRWREAARRIQREGVDFDNPDDEVPGVIVSAIAHHPPTDKALYRGRRYTPDELAALQVGTIITEGLASYAPDREVAEKFAIDPTVGGLNPGSAKRIPEGAVIPVVYVLDPGARAVEFTDVTDEAVSHGRYRVTAGPVMVGGGVYYVNIEQVSPLEEA